MKEDLVSKMEAAKIADNDKHQTTFAKDAARIDRYSLADTISSRENMDYHLQVITEDDRVRVLKFLRKFFFRDEPLNQVIQLIPDGEDSTCFELEEYSTSCLSGNLSLMAVSTTGDIIGALLNGELEPLKDGEPEYITNCGNPKFKKILKILNYVDKQANLAVKFPGKRILELRILSVDGVWRGRGVAKALVDKAESLARDLGFHMLRCDCSSHYSGKVCVRFGFEENYKLNYAEYVDNEGKPVFAPAHPHTAIVTYIKKL